MSTLPLFMEEVVSQKRQLMKWAGIFQVGIFRVKISLQPFRSLSSSFSCSYIPRGIC